MEYEEIDTGSVEALTARQSVMEKLGNIFGSEVRESVTVPGSVYVDVGSEENLAEYKKIIDPIENIYAMSGNELSIDVGGQTIRVGLGEVSAIKDLKNIFKDRPVSDVTAYVNSEKIFGIETRNAVAAIHSLDDIGEIKEEEGAFLYFPTNTINNDLGAALDDFVEKNGNQLEVIRSRDPKVTNIGTAR